jgi:hypothetical protein
MGDVKATRKDREQALAAYGHHPTASAQFWVETGVGGFSDQYEQLDSIANAIAQAREEGRRDAAQRLRYRAGTLLSPERAEAFRDAADLIMLNDD